MALTTLTSKGQVTIPKKVREALRLHTGDKIHFFITKDGDAISNGQSQAVENAQPCLDSHGADGLNDGGGGRHQNGLLDSGETNPRAWDTDGDGYNDPDEIRAGFDPLNPDSTPAIVCVESNGP